MNIGCLGDLVGRGDAREVRDLAGAGILVEALGVALFADLKRGVDEDRDELAGIEALAPTGARRGRGRRTRQA